ncbi:sterol desaturase family protein [Sphingomonas bacterium]|uniref:sterol desaturase family protein n=1 Tax=Sphingomonas bacterium TaxID=1895847 RepID=UPI001C2D247F|nr:sterol desaturase family protein [Sphingomonas bacterium]
MTQLIRLSIWLAFLAVVFLPLERLFALRDHRDATWRSTLADVGFYFLNSLLPAAVLGLVMAQVVLISRAALPAGYFRWTASLPIAVLLPAALLIAEFGFYWGHRLTHEWPVLWRFHAVHHEPAHLSWMINTRGHPVDMIFVRLCGLTPLYALGLAGFSDPRGNAIAALAIILGTMWGFFIHANIAVRLRPLEQLVATPLFHHWHHTREGAINRNYAAMLPIFDRLFGTFHMPNAWPVDYGISRGEDAAPDERGQA